MKIKRNCSKYESTIKITYNNRIYILFKIIIELLYLYNSVQVYNVHLSKSLISGSE